MQTTLPFVVVVPFVLFVVVPLVLLVVVPLVFVDVVEVPMLLFEYLQMSQLSMLHAGPLLHVPLRGSSPLSHAMH